MRGVIRHHRYDTTTDPSKGRLRREMVSWLGLILLAFNVLGAGALPVRAAEAGPAPFVLELQGDLIVVCTAAGMVVMDRDGNVVETGGPSSAHGALCVYCLPLMHGGAQAPAFVALAVEAFFLDGEVFLPAEPAAAVRPVLLPGTAAPRAPPAV